MEKSQTTDKLAKQVIADTSSKAKAKEKGHAYKHQTTTPVPAGLEKISIHSKRDSKKQLGKAKIILQKLPKSALEQLHCTVNQNYPLFFIEKSEAFQARKVQNVKLKERWIATRNIKNVSYQMQQWIYSQGHHKVKILKKDPVEFYDLLQKREERHFQIDRIIKYLSDK